MYDFERKIDRRNTRSYKWDQSEKLFGNSNILPLWVADMDFESPPAVKEAILRRVESGIYGYSVTGESYKQAIVSWYSRRHDWKIQPEWITDSPGIVTSLSLSVELLTKPGDEVILQSPVYYPFYDVINMNDRTVAKNPLILNNGRYEMDYAHLEEVMKGGAKLLLLCNPHNPGGTVWKREELLRLGELCLRYGVTVISDEIHCDMIMPGHKHIPFASLSEELADITVTTLAATKTFNLPGLQTSYIVAKNPELRRKYERKLKALSLHMSHYFAQEAVEAAYNEGEAWLDELIRHIAGNAEYAISYLAEHLPAVKVMRPEATYLLWLNCRALGLDAAGLKKLMYKEAEVAFNEGSVFGPEGEGHLRINLACPRSVLAEALQRFSRAAAPYVQQYN
ncbi:MULTISPECIES: MalY/PatB family protein [unclassified Paenibacillus]|uniref:MalY/PatB family protein n=1 Tax=unclassified Paenibacillus TaxID=185978 RepID=UPI002405E40A|nr:MULTISPECIES: MalY/PatB family protein [unclassified Paenibacillus]MDF9842257.1 cystathionine beta-lyase [Paenibacillus sp. PastF-2]MDF9848866.1 cystathionine beta-lyase [Paenibacillus sp. PastM-2]MDF9855436.1 cystathionine beta-lyase [Paenibacillus sp. PastF-1]MDH6480688.1 cystathionine beta-lyase [Paenibacillus sp. PastH-2]MDH6508131.1 cystathionine beta-lyase [Paenibacillus sp. PastM-3]